jgi:Xaa-Pro aminopeptidase
MTEVNNGKTVNELEEAAQAFHEAFVPALRRGMRMQPGGRSRARAASTTTNGIIAVTSWASVSRPAGPGAAWSSLRPRSDLELCPGMVFHLHSWFTNTGRGDYFVSNTALLTESGCEILTRRTPEQLQVK